MNGEGCLTFEVEHVSGIPAMRVIRRSTATSFRFYRDTRSGDCAITLPKIFEPFFTTKEQG